MSAATVDYDNEREQRYLDWLAKDAAAHGVDTTGEAAKRQLRAAEQEAGRTAADANAARDDEGKISDREAASRLATSPDLWVSSADGTAFASLPVDGHLENVPVRSSQFKRWLTLAFADARGKAPSTDAVSVATSYAEAVASRGPKHQVHIRIAHHGDAVYLDLCDEEWRAVEVDAAGWRIVDRPPVMFTRTADMQPLPMPADGGSLDALRPFLNASDDEAWTLMVAWLVGTMSDGPYPLLALSGAGGVGKTGSAKNLRRVVDPVGTPTRRGKVRSADDLAIAAKWSAVLIFDNLSGLSADMSDALCTLATGDGFGKRTLYTDDAEKLFYAKRPVILTGVEEVVTRGDLNSRTMMLNLPPLTQRRPERELEAEWAEAHPAILGSLLDAVSVALRRRDDVAAPLDVRMADFAQWVLAACPALGWTEDRFLSVYRDNREAAHLHEIESSPFSSAVLAWMQTNGPEWEGTASDLLAVLNHHAEASDMVKGDYWPKVAHKVTGRLNAHAEALKASGLTFTKRVSNGRKLLRLTMEAA